MKVIDLFSGIGGFSLGLERAGMETVAFCETEPFCRRVLAKNWPDVPIYQDVNSIDWKYYHGTIDLVCGGPPCQPFSVAGDKRGPDDNRNQWPGFMAAIRAIQPRWIIAENVPLFASMGFDDLLAEMECQGYQTWTFDLPACSVDAKHRRQRLWIVANAVGVGRSGRNNDDGRPVVDRRPLQATGPSPADKRSVLADPDPVAVRNEPKPDQRGEGTPKPSEDGDRRVNSDPYGQGQPQPEGAVEKVRRRAGDLCKPHDTDASGERLQERDVTGQPEGTGYASGPSFKKWQSWEAKSEFRRIPDGVSAELDPNRVARLRALGNAVVPDIVEIIGRAILEIEKEL